MWRINYLAKAKIGSDTFVAQPITNKWSGLTNIVACIADI